LKDNLEKAKDLGPEDSDEDKLGDLEKAIEKAENDPVKAAD